MMDPWSELFATAASDNPTTSTVDVSPTKTNEDWSQHLPASDQLTPPSPSPRRLLCPKCNTAICRLRTSNTARNPRRDFYTCPSPNHKFFKWADEVNPYQLIDVPICGGCGAGACRVRRETIGPNAGRILFTCRIKEGEGACGYNVWQDELEKLETAMKNERISSEHHDATNIDLVVGSNKVDEEEDIMTPIISEHRKCRAIISPKIGQSNKPNESSRTPHKRSRHGDLKASGSLVSPRSLEVRPSVNNVPTEYNWKDDAKRNNLSLQEEISSSLELLFQIEAEISCFEIEMRVMENQLEQKSRDKEELVGKYLIAFKELFERKEEERAAGKDVYDRARALLRR